MQNDVKNHNLIGSLSSNGATIAKIIATFSVVLTHSYKLFGYLKIEETDIMYLRGFHAFAACGVPIFFLLSGYFLTYKDNFDYVKNLKKKVKSLFIPYVLFTFLYAVISCAGSLVLPAFFDDFRKFTAYDWLIHLTGIPFVEGPRFYGPLWFLRDLIIFNLLSFVLVPFVKKVPNYIVIPLMLILYFMPISQFIRYPIVFFILGMCFGVKKCIPTVKNPILIAVIFLSAFVLPMIISPNIAWDISWKLSVLLMSVSIINVSGISTDNSRLCEIANKLIPYSFPVYLLHEYPMTTAMRLVALKHLSIGINVCIFLAAPFLIIAVCILVAYLWKRLLPKVFAMFFGGRY